MFTVNPGTEPLPVSDVDLAAAAMDDLAEDVATMMQWDGKPRFTRLPAEQDYETLYPGDGRYAFTLHLPDVEDVEIQMPGVPVDQVRYTDEDKDDESRGSIWDYPRIYVDGSSWIWYIGLRVLEDHINGVAT